MQSQIVTTSKRIIKLCYNCRKYWK